MSLAKHTARPRTYPRGADTRQRILDAAIKIFAVDGYDGATTRKLAERAGVTLPAIQYYFGSKGGLHRAVVARIAERIEAIIAPAATATAALLAQEEPSRKMLMARLYEMLDAFATLVMGSQHPESWAQFVARAEIENVAALRPVHDCINRQAIRPCAALIARLLDRPDEDEQILLRTLTILGQILIFKKCSSKRGAHDLGFTDPDEDRLPAVQALVREQTAVILRAARSAAS